MGSHPLIPPALSSPDHERVVCDAPIGVAFNQSEPCGMLERSLSLTGRLQFLWSDVRLGGRTESGHLTSRATRMWNGSYPFCATHRLP
ncbi:hypothetical protein VTO73DRAFT_2069 [Trametes versicolor]